MKIRFFRQHTYGDKIINRDDELDLPDHEALYFIRMGIALSVDEKQEIKHHKEKAEHMPTKEKKIVRVGRKSKKKA